MTVCSWPLGVVRLVIHSTTAADPYRTLREPRKLCILLFVFLMLHVLAYFVLTLLASSQRRDGSELAAWNKMWMFDTGSYTEKGVKYCFFARFLAATFLANGIAFGVCITPSTI